MEHPVRTGQPRVSCSGSYSAGLQRNAPASTSRWRRWRWPGCCVPEEREIFGNITVEENMRIGVQPPRPGAPAWTIDQMYDFFPQLKQRRDTAAGMLSGGEQQMLTMCRSLREPLLT